MVPEGFKSMDIQQYGEIIKRISKHIWIGVSFDWLVLWVRVRYQSIELGFLRSGCTLKVYAPVRSGFQTWSNIGSIFVVKNSGFWQLSQNPLVKHGAFM